MRTEFKVLQKSESAEAMPELILNDPFEAAAFLDLFPQTRHPVFEVCRMLGTPVPLNASNVLASIAEVRKMWTIVEAQTISELCNTHKEVCKCADCPLHRKVNAHELYITIQESLNKLAEIASVAMENDNMILLTM